MKIGICGTHGSGKTTLARLLAPRLELPLIQEQARRIMRVMGIESESRLRAASPDVGLRFQWQCLRQQLIAESAYPKGFISDRTVIDNAAYWLANNHAHETKSRRLDYVRLCRAHASSYDLVLYCPPLPGAPEDDGVRMTDPDYRDEIDLLIQTLLLGWKVNFVRVEGDKEKRFKQVLTIFTRGWHRPNWVGAIASVN